MKRIKKLLAAFLALGLLASCSPTQPQKSETPDPDMGSTKAKFTAGTYSVVGQGRGGDIAVDVTFSDEGITDIKIGEHQETQGICESAFETIPQMIIDNQTLAVDVIAGATLTSNGIIEAVKDAVSKAGGDPSAMMTPVQKAEGQKIELNTDVVVVGAGGSGLSAAVEASAAGASVIIVEAQSYIGGATAMSGGWLLSTATEEESAEFGGLTVEGLNAGLKAYETENVDPVISEMVVQNARANADWVLELAKAAGRNDIEIYYFEGMYPLDPADETSTNYKFRYAMPAEEFETMENGYGGWMTDSLWAQAKKNGAQLYLNTTATSVLSENGAAVGITAEDNQGNTYTITAKSVILASGGFGGNREIAEQYNGEFDEYLGPKTNTGFGIWEGQRLGAKTDFPIIEMEPSEDSGLEEGGLLSTVGGLIVNENGQVLDTNDVVIPGLYGVGEVSSVVVIDLPYFAGGHHLAWNLFIGRAAGQHAAAAAK